MQFVKAMQTLFSHVLSAKYNEKIFSEPSTTQTEKGTAPIALTSHSFTTYRDNVFKDPQKRKCNVTIGTQVCHLRLESVDIL